ncbi:FliI/YscN family ATPase [Actinokineospora globicatena]|uniref:EscN/YscN/HrcN family type III secretion system ATPase n=1 Tax=Actinokineospora globicatena TaxID=103729 RepID=A0A9W6QMI8_9PSEU|nr:FliI/YscN family ATPase [Actinokineospora globicatena]GLW93143.1 EscN/YscN/HrcN family type III secretion system ATPase [Actinokineospora globicatena]
MTSTLRESAFGERFAALLPVARPSRTGVVVGVVGLAVTVAGIVARIGDLVRIGPEEQPLLAEVVALDHERVVCLPLGPLGGVGVGSPVVNTGGPLRIAVGEELRGRVLDGLGNPMDGGPPLTGLARVSVDMAPPSAMERSLISEPLQLGVRALDTMVPCGHGQRIGIFAGSGVGKSSLLSMITRGTQAEITVIALIGERGREVREFLENDLGPEGLARSVVIVATSDQPPLVRLRAGFVATRIAEFYRDTGKNVLLMMDSLTRIAMAQREVGLSAGEPPATRGFPPSVFALLPTLLERAGPAPVGGITGLYTVLVEGDDHNEPIADAARSILDGHVVLDRKLATAGHFPSIEVLESVSRVTGAITTREQRTDSATLRRLLAAQRDVRELVEIGAYVPGTNPDADRALALRGPINDFLRQSIDDQVPATVAWEQLSQLLHGSAPTGGGH